MPIELIAPDPETQVESFLTESGALTLEAEVMAAFLNEADFSALFDDPDVRQFVQDEELAVYEDEFGRVVPILDEEMFAESVTDDTNVGLMRFESIDGEIAAEFIDEADLSAMFEYYIKHEHPSDTLADRTALSLFGDMLAEGALEEKWKSPFKKGDFHKGAMAGVSAASKGTKKTVHRQRVRMMLAMLGKGVIKRVKPGTGYGTGRKDYARASGYPSGVGAHEGHDTPANLMEAYKTIPTNYKGSYSNYLKYAHKNKAVGSYVDPGRRKVVQMIYKNIGAQMPKNWVPPEKRSGGAVKTAKKITVKKDKLDAMSKGKALFKKGAATDGAKPVPFQNPFKKGKKIDASHDVDYTLHEGAGLAGAVAHVGARQARLETPTRLLETQGL